MRAPFLVVNRVRRREQQRVMMRSPRAPASAKKSLSAINAQGVVFQRNIVFIAIYLYLLKLCISTHDHMRLHYKSMAHISI